MTVHQSPARQRLLGEQHFDWRWPVAAALLALQLLFVVWLIAQPGGGTALIWFDDLTFIVAPSLASLTAGLVAVRNWGSRTGSAWALIALGLLMITFGETAWGVQELGLGMEVPFPSLADIGYLGIYPPVFLGLLLMPQAPVNGFRRLKFSLDTLIAILAIAIISWYLILAELIDQSGDSVLGKSVSVAYPFADLGIVFAVLILVGRSSGIVSGAAMACLAGGFAAIAFADSLYTYLTSVKGYATGNYIDVGWILGYNLVTLAALIALSRRIVFEPGAQDEQPTPSFWRSLLPYVPVVPLAAMQMVALQSQDTQTQLNLFLEAGTLAVFALIIARQVLTIYENVHLNRELANLTAQLELRVKTQTLQMLRRAGSTTSDSNSGERAPHPSDQPLGGLPTAQR